MAPHARLLLFTAFQVSFEERLHFAGGDTEAIDRYRRKARADAASRVHALVAACASTLRLGRRRVLAYRRSYAGAGL
ncbi:MAG TPA: hypothetical protein PKC22_02000 [Rhodocyclaceae bacterium]|nr:hypothetical protein [Rhodocyclaceae bacterium]